MTTVCSVSGSYGARRSATEDRMEGEGKKENRTEGERRKGEKIEEGER